MNGDDERDLTKVEWIRRYERVKGLVESPDFQELLVKPVREELAGLKDIPFGLGVKVNADQARALELCGLATPKDARELYEVFLATKAVVYYVEGKLRQLESQSAKFYELQQRLAEERAEEEAEAKEEKEGMRW